MENCSHSISIAAWTRLGWYFWFMWSVQNSRLNNRSSTSIEQKHIKTDIDNCFNRPLKMTTFRLSELAFGKLLHQSIKLMRILFWHSIIVLKMKVQLFLVVLFSGLLLVPAELSTSTEEPATTIIKSNSKPSRVFRTVRAKDSKPTIKPTPVTSVKNRVNEAIFKLKTDVTEMKDLKKYDDKVLISDVTLLAELLLGSLKGVPVAVQPQLSSLLSQIQSKIDLMSISGKFDRSVVDDFDVVDKVLNNSVLTTTV